MFIMQYSMDAVNKSVLFFLRMYLLMYLTVNDSLEI
jgi:hypothetical protein